MGDSSQTLPDKTSLGRLSASAKGQSQQATLRQNNSSALPETSQDPVAEQKARRRGAKGRQFRQYLVDSGMYDLIVKLLVGIMERPQPEGSPRPINAEELITDVFGSYRDPRWDEVESLWDAIESEKGRRSNLTEQVAELEEQLELETKKVQALRLWRALGGTQGEELPGKDLVAKIVGPLPKKPPEAFMEAGEPPAAISFPLWTERMVRLPEEVRSWACVGLLEKLTASPEEPPYAGELMTDEELLTFLRALSSQFHASEERE